MESRVDGCIVPFNSIRRLVAVSGVSKSQKVVVAGSINASLRVLFDATDDILYDFESANITYASNESYSLENYEMWVSTVRDCILFCSVPLPEAHSDRNRVTSTTTGGLDASAANDAAVSGGFRAVSNTVFNYSGDTIYILSSALGSIRVGDNESLKDLLESTCQLLTEIMNALPNVKCNKDAFGSLSDRFEEFIRILFDPNFSGILLDVKENDHGLVSFQLNSLVSKSLKDALAFITIFVSPGWMQESIAHFSDTMFGGLQKKFDQIDQDVFISRGNRLIKGLGANQFLFKPVRYAMVVEVVSSIDTIGGVEKIYANHAKVQALARMLQAEPADIVPELEVCIEKQGHVIEASDSQHDLNMSLGDRHGVSVATSGGHRDKSSGTDKRFHSSQHSMTTVQLVGSSGTALAVGYSDADDSEARGGEVSFWRRYLCCCLQRSRAVRKQTYNFSASGGINIGNSSSSSSSSNKSGLKQSLL
jgi:hypothetical protein